MVKLFQKQQSDQQIIDKEGRLFQQIKIMMQLEKARIKMLLSLWVVALNT